MIPTVSFKHRIDGSNTEALIWAAIAGLLLGGCAEAARGQEVATSALGAQTPDPGSGGPKGPKDASEAEWRANATFYLFFPGVHGNLNAYGYDVGFKASPGDLLSHANLALMGLVGAQYKRLVVISDLIWSPLTGERTKVFDRLPNAPSLSAEVKYTQVMFSPEVGYRAIDHKKVTIDGLAGFRYWHQGTTLTLTPQPSSFTNNYKSKDWVDPVLGARIQVPLSPKLLATIWGDAGGFDAGAKLDYQIIGALTYQFKPKWAFGAAWRYLYVDYGSTDFSTQTAQSGIAIAVTYRLK
jgi:hypothetical protein